MKTPLLLFIVFRAGLPANFFPSPAFFFQAFPAPHFFSQAAPAPRGQKHAAPALKYLLSW